MINLLIDHIGLWFAFSIIILILWGLMMGDPGTSKTGDIIITVICGVLALPITLIILSMAFGLHIYIALKIKNDD